MKKSLITALLGCFLATPLFVQAENSYVSVGVGQSNYDHPGYDENGTGVSIAFGQSITDVIGYEVGYVHFGSVESDGLKLDNQSVYLAGVGTYPLSEAFSAYGKLGATINRYSGESAFGSDSETRLRPLIGAGLGYKFAKEWSGAIEYVYFGETSDLKMSMWSANLRYHF